MNPSKQGYETTRSDFLIVFKIQPDHLVLLNRSYLHYYTRAIWYILASSTRPKWHPNPQSLARFNMSTPFNSILALRFKSFKQATHSCCDQQHHCLLIKGSLPDLVPSNALWGVWTAWLDWCNNVTKSSCDTNVYSCSMYLESVFWLYSVHRHV